MKKLLVKISVAVMLIGGFAIVPHSVQPTHVADPGGGVIPPGGAPALTTV